MALFGVGVFVVADVAALLLDGWFVIFRGGFLALFCNDAAEVFEAWSHFVALGFTWGDFLLAEFGLWRKLEDWLFFLGGSGLHL